MPTPVGYIRPEIAHLAVPLHTITAYPGNPRRGDLTRITTSLTAHGQYTPLLIHTTTRHVIKGNHTLTAMQALGWTHAAVIPLQIDADRAAAIVLIDNWTTDPADYDPTALTDLLAGVADWTTVGWTPTDLDNLITGLPADETPDPVAALPTTDPPTTTHPGRKPATPTRTRTLPLTYLPDEHREAHQHLTDARTWLGPHLTDADIILRALRALTVIGDTRTDPHAVIRVGTLLLTTGYDPNDQP